MIELWAPVPDFVGLYEASSLGRVRRLRPRFGNGILSGTLDRDGYQRVFLYCDGRRTTVRVHRLVCRAFHGAAPSSQHEVCHADGNRLNNRASNLRWGTRSENVKDSLRHGTHAFVRPTGTVTRHGIEHHSAKLTDDIVREARRRFANGESGAKLAKEFGTTQANMSSAIRGATWKHVGEAICTTAVGTTPVEGRVGT